MSDVADSTPAAAGAATEAGGTTEPILAPEEIEALMQTLAPSEQAHAMLATLPPIEQPKEVGEFKFSEESDNGPERYPLFQNLQQRVTEALKEQWSEEFQREVGLVADGIKPRTYEDILKDDVEMPQVYFVYDVEGFGKMMVTYDLQLVVAYVDAKLGGQGESFNDDAEVLSPVEMRLSTRIAASLQKLLQGMWAPVMSMRYTLAKIDVDAQFLAVAPSSEICFSVQFQVQVSDKLQGNISMHYPRTFLEPILDNLRAAISEEPAAMDEEWERALHKSMEQVPLTVRLELGQCTLNIKQFLALRAGDFLPLSKNENEPSTLWVSSTPMYRAMPGSKDGMLAAELTVHLAQDE